MSRIFNQTLDSVEEKWENTLRPKKFGDFPGQQKVKEKIEVFVRAAKGREEPLDHILLSGPPGLGKTTLAHIIANEFGVECFVTSGPALEKKGDLAAILTSLKPFSVLFIDEIHRLSRVVEEYLYSAMEDYALDLVTGEGLGARAMRFQLSPFTLIGATTRTGLLNAPFRDRFGIIERLNFYDYEDLVKIIRRSAGIMGITIEEKGAQELARRCRGTPRIANRLLRRVRDYSEVSGQKMITDESARHALGKLEIDEFGLDPMDRQILELILKKFSGGPVGLDTLSAALNEDRDTLEDVYEPYLLQQGFIMKTPRGRVTTELTQRHLSDSAV